MALSVDPSWPRAGDWPAPGDAAWDAVIVGVPASKTSLSPTGAHETPAAVRAALRRYSPTLMGARQSISSTEGGAATPGPVDLGAVLRIADAGDIADPDGPAGETAVCARTRDLAARSDLVVALGGDNSITYAVAQGAGARGLITLDAHFDLRDGISNGSPVRRLVEAGLDPTRIVQIGIADFANSAVYAQRAADLGIRVITLDELRSRPFADIAAEAITIAGGGARAGDARADDARAGDARGGRAGAGAGSGGIHLDIDVDVCDRAVAPGCPASVPGGLQAWELRALVRLLASNTDVRSADIVEVDATADASDGRTVRLAALCVLELLAAVHLREGAAA